MQSVLHAAFVKIDGQEPTYRLELEAAKIWFASIDKLVGQQSILELGVGQEQFSGSD